MTRFGTRPGTVRATVVLTLGLCWSAPAGAAERGVPDQAPAVVGTAQVVHLRPRASEVQTTAQGYVWSHLLSSPGASFVKAHFVDVNLRRGDVLVLRARNGRVVEEIRERGPKDMGSFWALSAFGEELSLELTFARPYRYVPFTIDRIIPGDPAMFEPIDGSTRSVCAPEDFDDVLCYQSDAGKWSNVMASVGVMSVGGNPNFALFCSGSNISPLNYVMTNNHCITTQNGCDNSEFVFKFYRTTCNTGAPATADWQSFHCDDLVASSPFISCDQGLGDLDFSLCSVIGDPADTFGFARPDPTPVVDGEALYMIQHPAGRPHEITHGSGADVDVSGTVLRYYDTMDSEGGSSGSPIYRESDDMLVGLHHCGGCESPGVGNRGMLMRDIHPLIEGFLCAPAVEIAPETAVGLAPVHGNGDALVDPGEIWQFVPRVVNNACSQAAIDLTAQVQVAASSQAAIAVLDPLVEFGNVPGGAIGVALAPVRFRVHPQAPCGAEFAFDLVSINAANAGPFDDAPLVLSAELGEEPIATVLFDDFDTPLGWSIVNGGTGTGPAATWTTANPGGRFLELTDPFYIVDSFALGFGFSNDEQLTSPVLDLSSYSSVRLQFRHDFNWYAGGTSEKGEVAVRSSATGGAWVTVASYQGGDAAGMVDLNISALAHNQADVQLRFRYYDANYELWWALDDVYVLGSNGSLCHPLPVRLDPVGGSFGNASGR